ncbi:hypothetical protein CC78DRAFT_606310 [Lojkania enalia]|uniref:Uncharacterized protein n=1 Tax=Lojkania enalia TaxID=147567 RepID=A0A9P4N269_9PLEO|nr:hypothetical protein CC78DRAFT_606310 [Didymosphaeria enalia]
MLGQAKLAGSNRPSAAAVVLATDCWEEPATSRSGSSHPHGGEVGGRVAITAQHSGVLVSQGDSLLSLRAAAHWTALHCSSLHPADPAPRGRKALLLSAEGELDLGQIAAGGRRAQDSSSLRSGRPWLGPDTTRLAPPGTGCDLGLGQTGTDWESGRERGMRVSVRMRACGGKARKIALGDARSSEAGARTPPWPKCGDAGWAWDFPAAANPANHLIGCPSTCYTTPSRLASLPRLSLTPAAEQEHPPGGLSIRTVTTPLPLFEISSNHQIPILRAMASQMEWSYDFCLSCDRQIQEGNYCSQACRLAEMEKAGSSESTATSQLSSSASSSSSSSHGFYLPPAYNFSAAKNPSPSRGFDLGPSSPQYYATAHGNYYTPAATSPTTTTNQPQQRSLTPSSSRSSLASAASQAPSSGISFQAAQQLNSYVRSFDQVRDLKRRHTQY